MAKSSATNVLAAAEQLGSDTSCLEGAIEALEASADSIQVLRRAELELQMATETLLSARHFLAERIRAAGQLRLNQNMGRG